MTKSAFLDSFPNHGYRYIDQTGLKRPPVSSATIVPKLNPEGYESYFTVNGFSDPMNAVRENLTNINAFFVDIDGRKDPVELAEISTKLGPTFIIETMRGVHIYWLLDEPIYKEELKKDEWEAALARWELLEQNIVTALHGDPVVKDVTRIMRIPNTLYWKKSGDAYKGGIEKALFKIRGMHKNLAATYSMDRIAEAFPLTEKQEDKIANVPFYSKEGQNDFFRRVEKHYPLDQRPSFQSITSGATDDFVKAQGRNQMLIVAASLMRQAGLNPEECFAKVQGTGWHGMELERGGWEEIKTTIMSAYKGGYTYSKNNPIIAHYMPDGEALRLQAAYAAASKERKELDTVRFQTYEKVLQAKHPHLRINEVGMIFTYKDGVYSEADENFMMNAVLDSMEQDALFCYRTRNHVKDKIACWIALIPKLVINEDEYVLNVKNGLLNVKSRKLFPHNPEYVSLYQMPVEYKPEVSCPMWLKCLHAWTSGDDEGDKTKMLQQYAGYCLTNSTKFAKMLILVGDGGNGKSTFADTISMLVGKRGTSHISLETLEKNFGPGELLGKRLNIVEEISGNFYHSHILKKIISGEEVTTDKKYYAHFTFKPTAKFIFAVNEMPRVDDSSQATERRMLVVMFNNNFRENANTELRFEDGLLAKELSGILNWALDGADSLRAEGAFVVTSEQEKAIKEYREENSSADAFMSEVIEIVEGAICEASDVYEKYVIFCRKGGLKPWSRIRLTKHLKLMGIRLRTFRILDRENNHDTYKFEGLRINENWKHLVFDEGRIINTKGRPSFDEF